LESMASTHFPITTEGVGGDRTNVRSILPLADVALDRLIRDAKTSRRACSPLVYPERFAGGVTRLPAVAGHSRLLQSDELTHMESHSCIKPPGRGSQGKCKQSSLRNRVGRAQPDG